MNKSKELIAWENIVNEHCFQIHEAVITNTTITILKECGSKYRKISSRGIPEDYFITSTALGDVIEYSRDKTRLAGAAWDGWTVNNKSI